MRQANAFKSHPNFCHAAMLFVATRCDSGSDATVLHHKIYTVDERCPLFWYYISNGAHSGYQVNKHAHGIQTNQLDQLIDSIAPVIEVMPK